MVTPNEHREHDLKGPDDHSPRHRRREKMFGEGRLLPLYRNAKARIMVFARALASIMGCSPPSSWPSSRPCSGASTTPRPVAASSSYERIMERADVSARSTV